MGKASRSAQTDELTVLPTYAAFAEALAVQLGKADEAGASVSVALVDIDWFRKVNDEQGREAADSVLRCLAEHLAKCKVEGAALFRYGGDELVLLMPGTEKEQAFLSIEKAREAFSEELGREHGKVRATISGGVAAFPEDGTTSQDILRKVNDAAHRAKEASSTATPME